jgi:hypothetical protein
MILRQLDKVQTKKSDGVANCSCHRKSCRAARKCTKREVTRATSRKQNRFQIGVAMIRWIQILELAILFRSTLCGGNSWLRCIRCARATIDASDGDEMARNDRCEDEP